MSLLLNICTVTSVSQPKSIFGCARSVSSKRGGSSSRYLDRQNNDVFVKQRLNAGYGQRKSSAGAHDAENDAAASSAPISFVSRSAFKLLQLDDKYRMLRAGRTIVDLGAAPGGWSQAIVARIARSQTRRRILSDAVPSVFALDILPMAPIEGVTCLQGDFLDPIIQNKLKRKVKRDSQSSDTTIPHSNSCLLTPEGGFVDVVLSDMMSNTSGNTIADSEASLSLCQAAFDFAATTLRSSPNAKIVKAVPDAASTSVLVMKYFMSHEAEVFRKEVLERSFLFVKSEKMEASRKSSREQFWVCIGFKGHNNKTD